MKTFKSYRTQRKRPQSESAVEKIFYFVVGNAEIILLIIMATAGLMFLVSVIGR